jgi:hypothetical protein
VQGLKEGKASDPKDFFGQASYCAAKELECWKAGEGGPQAECLGGMSRKNPRAVINLNLSEINAYLQRNFAKKFIESSKQYNLLNSLGQCT